MAVVLIAARGPRAVVERRVGALARWYGLAAEQREVAGGAVTLAALGVPVATASYGEAPPATLRLLDASADELRRYTGFGAAFGASADRARIVAGAGGPASLYKSESAEVAAWATHAAAAAFVAHGSAAVDPAALPELVAAEFVGGKRSIVAAAEPCDAALAVDFSATRAEEGCWWPAVERWSPIAEDDAYSHAEAHLLRGLVERLASGGRPVCGLTAGIDSRTAALSLEDLGIGFEAATWGSPGDEDVAGGEQAAAALGVTHTAIAPGAEPLARARHAARLHEGAAHPGFGGVDWPAGATAFVTGAGGGTGRAFYYRGRAAEPPPGDLAGAVADALAERLAGAHEDAVAALRSAGGAWVAEAERTGHRGWRVLDVLYGQQRLRRWLRGTQPPGRPPALAAFATPEVQRALVSLPLADRSADGFQRRFIAARRPELLPSGGRRLRPGQVLGAWRTDSAYREWIADDVLGHPLAADALGERWCGRTRSRFFAGDPAAVERALLLSGAVALAEGLAELGRA